MDLWGLKIESAEKLEGGFRAAFTSQQRDIQTGRTTDSRYRITAIMEGILIEEIKDGEFSVKEEKALSSSVVDLLPKEAEYGKAWTWDIFVVAVRAHYQAMQAMTSRVQPVSEEPTSGVEAAAI